jgi:HK97 gp10 family phage protein
MADDIILIDHTALLDIMNSPALRDAMVEASRPRILAAQIAAPKRTGLGAASIHPEAILDGQQWIVEVSWSQERYYMKFHEQGTRYMPPRPFLAPAFQV